MAGKSESKTLPKARDEAERRTTSFPFVIREIDARVTSAIVLSIFVLLFSLLTITSFLRKSPTVDEPVHLFAGYSYLRWGDFRVNPEHPPLAKILAALPLLAFDIKDPRLSSHDWDLIPKYSPRELHAVNVAAKMLFLENDAETLFFYAKLQMILLGILLGIFVYFWSKELCGPVAAIFSFFIYCLDPNILAHTQLVHTDIPFTTFFFIGTYFFWRALGQLSWSNVILTSLFFGLAAITKYAYLASFLIWGILGVWKILSPQPQRSTIGVARTVSSRWGKVGLLTGLFMSVVITGYIFIWTAYGFRFHAIPGPEQYLPMAQEMPEKAVLQRLVFFITQYRIFPEAWIYGQLHIFNNLNRDAYLLGSSSDQGFWLYFPVALVVKTPLPTLLLLVATLGIWIFRRKYRMPGLFLLIPVVVYFSLAVLSRMNIGLRHILPIYIRSCTFDWRNSCGALETEDVVP